MIFNKKAVEEITWISLAMIVLLLLFYLSGNITGYVILNQTSPAFGILPINETIENISLEENITEPLFEIPELNITENITLPLINITIPEIIENFTLPEILPQNLTQFKLTIKDKQEILKEITLENKTYPYLEITLNNIINKIEFNNLVVNKDIELNLANITKGIIPPENIEFKKIYAIDLSTLDFDNATIITKAISSKLFKCKLFDFNLGICLGSWEEILNLTKNQEYSFTLNKTDPGFAEGEEITLLEQIVYVFDATTAPGINFTNPTPANITSISNTFIQINISITNASDLAEVKWNWNGTNYTFYNDSLVLMFNFNNVSAIGENATHAVDVSKYSNNGTISGAIWNASGRYGSALQFDGVNDYVDAGNDASLNIDGKSFTILMWIKPKDFDQEGLISKFYDGALRQNLHIILRNDSGWFLRFGFYSDDLDVANPNISRNEWAHVAFTYNTTSNEQRTFINSVQKGNRTTGGDLTNTDGKPFQIGRIHNRNSEAFNGTIDEVRIWNRSLTASEIQQHYYSNLYKYDTDKWQFYSNQSNLTAGSYTYSGCAKDTSGNENCTEIRSLTVDILAPNVSLISPINNSENITTNDIQFNFNTTENGTCSLFIDYIHNTSITSTANTTLNMSALDFSVGDFLWNVNCSDTTGNNNASSQIWNFSVLERNPPNISLIAPLNNSINTTTNIIDFQFNTTEAGTCSLYLDFILKNSRSVSANTTLNITAVDLANNQDFWWNVNCTDTSRNNKSSELWNFSISLPDTIKPVVYLIAPLNNTNNASTNDLSFTFNTSENGGTCNLFINYVLNTTLSIVTANTTLNLSAINFPVGDFLWNVNCSDASGNINSSGVYNASVSDDISPNVYLIAPVNNSENTTTNDITFQFNNSEIGACSLYIDYIWNNSKTVNANVTENISALNFFANNDYWWNVNCTDETGRNNKSSEIWNFSVSYFDVAPVINTVHLSPTTSYTNTTRLDCIFNISDLDITNTLTWNITWWNSTNKYNLDNQTNATLASQLNNLNYSTNTTGALEAADIAKWELWLCEVWVTDGVNHTSKNSSAINITNLPPDLKENIPDQSWQQDSSTTINLTNYFNDTDQDNLDYAIQSSPSNIGVSINNDTGIATLTSPTSWYGTSYIIFNVTDATDWTNSNNITLTVTAKPTEGAPSPGAPPPAPTPPPPEEEIIPPPTPPPQEIEIPTPIISLPEPLLKIVEDYYNQLNPLDIEGHYSHNCTYITIDSSLIKSCIKEDKPILSISFGLPKGAKPELPTKINYNLLIFLLILILLAILFFKRRKKKKIKVPVEIFKEKFLKEIPIKIQAKEVRVHKDYLLQFNVLSSKIYEYIKNKDFKKAIEDYNALLQVYKDIVYFLTKDQASYLYSTLSDIYTKLYFLTLHRLATQKIKPYKIKRIRLEKEKLPKIKIRKVEELPTKEASELDNLHNLIKQNKYRKAIDLFSALYPGLIIKKHEAKLKEILREKEINLDKIDEINSRIRSKQFSFSEDFKKLHSLIKEGKTKEASELFLKLFGGNRK